jgi:hypothetical protein
MSVAAQEIWDSLFFRGQEMLDRMGKEQWIGTDHGAGTAPD